MRKAIIVFLSFILFCAVSCQKQNESKKVSKPNLFRVIQNGKWGLIDKTGKIVINPQFDDICYFNEDKIAVKINGKWGR